MNCSQRYKLEINSIYTLVFRLLNRVNLKGRGRGLKFIQDLV